MVPNEKIFARYPGGDSWKRLPDLCAELVDSQREAWPAFRRGIEALDQVEVRTLRANGFTTRLQWNPQRIVSTAAKVDAASIQARRCFLCVENLPEAQRGILYRDDFLILCNPSPIFPSHFTVTHVEHRPQDILQGIDTTLLLARDLGDGFTVFYNGPRCGASAPDHLHLQAVPAGSIPTEADLKQASKKDVLGSADGVGIWKIPFYGRTHCILTASDDTALLRAFGRFLAAWKKVAGDTREPMLNLLVVPDGEMISLLLFVRSKHRPDDYFKDGEERVLVSPASVDIGGHIVTPVEKDFHEIDGPYLERMFQEVSEPPSTLTAILHEL